MLEDIVMILGYNHIYHLGTMNQTLGIATVLLKQPLRSLGKGGQFNHKGNP
jgi:hypothetical protein